MTRSLLESWIVVALAILVAIIVFVLQITGILTIMDYETYYISSFAFALLNMLALLTHYQREIGCTSKPYQRLVAAGTTGMLADLFITTLLTPSATTAIILAVAIEFFFLTLSLGGDYLLLTETGKLRSVQACENSRG